MRPNLVRGNGREEEEHGRKTMTSQRCWRETKANQGQSSHSTRALAGAEHTGRAATPSSRPSHRHRCPPPQSEPARSARGLARRREPLADWSGATRGLAACLARWLAEARYSTASWEPLGRM